MDSAPLPSSDDAPATARRGRRGPGRNLGMAVASGLALAGLYVLTLFIHPLLFLTFIAVIVVVAMLELDVAFRGAGMRPATPVAIGAGMIMLFGAYRGGPGAQALGLVLLVFGSVAWSLLDVQRPQPAANLGSTFLMTLWVPFAGSYLGLLLLRGNGEWVVLATIALAVTSDIGAYAFGSQFGRHRMAPTVSPGKSWEGFAGALATSLVVAALVTSRLPGFDLGLALAFGATMCVAATAGDLAESLVKRDLGVKDLGTIVPGHGGMMDRIDAITFALPSAHLLLLLLGR
ncbi:MAG: phosphatidate cytidylyltransferase [Egibacteraceae bacterium]